MAPTTDNASETPIGIEQNIDSDSPPNNSDQNTENTLSTVPLAHVSPKFTPESGARFPSTGNVVVDGIQQATTICISIDEVQPIFSNGICQGDGVQQIDNPPADLSISFSCDSQSGNADQSRSIKLLLANTGGELHQEQANYTLTCALEAPPIAENIITGSLAARQPDYLTIDDITLVYAVSFSQNQTEDGISIGIFKEQTQAVTCDNNIQPLLSAQTAAATGEVIFQPLAAGRYKAQIVDQTGCPIGAPAPFQVIEPQTLVYRFQEGEAEYEGTDDTSIAKAGPLKNTPQGSASEIEADGRDLGDGESAILLRWQLPEALSGTVTEAHITLEIRDETEGTYGIYTMMAYWQEETALWDSVKPSINQGPLLLGEIQTTETGRTSFPLNEAGVALIQSWVDDQAANYGFIIRDINTGDGIKIRTSEYRRKNKRPLLELTTLE